MTHYSFLTTDLRCPACDRYFDDRLWFQWGYSPGRAPRDEYIYHLGDSVYWKPCQNGVILPWVYFLEGGGNFGDPAYKNVVVRDARPHFLSEPCAACKHLCGGAAMEIKNGIIQRAWVYAPGELDDKVDIYVVNQAAQLQPMSEWNDHPMPTIKDC